MSLSTYNVQALGSPSEENSTLSCTLVECINTFTLVACKTGHAKMCLTLDLVDAGGACSSHRLLEQSTWGAHPPAVQACQEDEQAPGSHRCVPCFVTVYGHGVARIVRPVL